MKRLLITTATIYLAFTLYCHTQGAKLIKGTSEHGIHCNYEVYIDTTGISGNFNSITLKDRVYSKSGYILILNDGTFNKQYDINGNPVKVQSLTLDDMSSEYRNDLLPKFELIIEKYGLFQIIYTPSLNNKEEEIEKKSAAYHLTFDTLIKANELLDYMNYTVGLPCDFYCEPHFPNLVPNDRSLDGWSKARDILTYNPGTFWEMNFHSRGFGWNIYSLKMPLAWEISKGDSQIVVAVYDIFGDGMDDPHPDLPINQTINDEGNWLVIDNTNYFNGNSTQTYYPTFHLTSNAPDHGILDLSMAISLMDNDNQTLPAMGGHVGTCPDCRGLGFWTGNLSYTYMDYDTDLLDNDIIEPISVLSYSWSGAWYTSTFQDFINNGLLMVGSAANNIAKECACNGDYMINGLFFGDYTQHGNIVQWHTRYDGIGQNVYTPSIYPHEDYKILAIAGIQDGDLFNKFCEPWICGQNTYWFEPPTHKYDEKVIPDWMFSPGVNKFSINPNLTTREADKRNAYIDLVVPAKGLMTATNGRRNPACDIYEFKSAAWNLCNCPDLNPKCLLRAEKGNRKYNHGVTGTSPASPQAAGVLGLMSSLNRYMGVPLDINKRPIVGADVQRRAYDIVTFTADKIIDNGEVPEPFWCGGFLNFLPHPAQPNYLVQHNDRLKRTWAQRTGFGKLNAYRSMAHSIRQKGLYEYSLSENFLIPFLPDDLSGDPRGYVNPKDKRVMHWGSKVKEGNGMFEMPILRGPTTGNDGILNVLEWGGISLPGEFHNNQGVTKVTNSIDPDVRLKLTVPIDCILAIDGVLFSEQPNACHYIITSGTGDSTGKILMEGYIKDIEIFGNLRLGDLIIESTINDGVASIPGAVGFGSGYESEMYGHITTLNYGLLYLWGNAHAKPGTIISLNGSEDLILHGTSELHLEHASRIETNQGRKLIVQNNTKLIVNPRSIVELDLEVNVKQGGEFIISDSTIVKLKKLNVEPGGTIRINPGSTLSLREQEHICNGHFIADGTTEKIRIVGNIGEHCLNYDEVDYTAFPHLTTQPTIYFRGECLQPFLTSITLLDVEFKNIAINAYNTQIMLPITNCEFLTNTKLTNPYFNFPYLLSLRFNNCDLCPSPFTSYVEIDNCKFKDFAQPTSSINDPNNLNELEFRTGGIMIDGYKNVKIVSTQFANLEYGISSFDCDTVFINSSRFDSCGIGNYDFASCNVMCTDTFNVVQYGTIRDHSMVSKAFDNIYNITRIGYRAESSLTQKLRDNVFNEYLQGVSISNADLRIKDEPIPGIPDNYLIYGANTFEITPFPPQLTGYINKFITRDCERYLSTDINLENSKCLLEIQCGRNTMSSNAMYHLRRDITDGGIVAPINVSYNHFQPNLIPRTSNLTLNWTPGTLQYSDSFKDYFCCGDLGYYSTELTCNWDTWYPEIDCIEFDNGLFVEQPAHGKIKNTYDDLYKKYNSDNNLTTKDIIEDYIENKSLLIGYNSETESNSNSTLNENMKFLQLILDYKNDRVDRLDENNHPYAEYFKFLTKTKLSKLEVDEFLSTSSLLSFVRSRANDTCSQNLSNIQNTTNPEALKITSIAPVPISETGIICFSLSNDSKVSFSISNLIGTTSNSINVEKFFNPGDNCFELSFKDLSPGMYFMTISDGVNSDTKNFIISR